MRELSIFVDESGDAGEVSKYYLITLVFHEQTNRLDQILAPYSQNMLTRTLPDIPMHLGPLLSGHDDYENLSVSTRKQLLATFRTLAKHLPYRYKTLSYLKTQHQNDSLLLQTKLKRDLTDYLLLHLDYFQHFEAVKIYYDNGQPIVTEALHQAMEHAVSRSAIVYKDAKPAEYRLFQLADYICTLELIALKYSKHEETPTDTRFFGMKGSFKKNYLREIRRNLL